MSDWYCFKCPKCGHIQSKEIRTDITTADFRCQKCEKVTKIYDAKKGRIRMDYKSARDERIAMEICKIWKFEEMKEDDMLTRNVYFWLVFCTIMAIAYSIIYDIIHNSFSYYGLKIILLFLSVTLFFYANDIVRNDNLKIEILKLGGKVK